LPGILLDTNAVIRRLTEPHKLSREQNRVLDDLEHQGQPFGVSAITLLELAVLQTAGDRRVKGGTAQVLRVLEDSPACRVVPFSIEIALEVVAIAGALKDPADRAVVATARVHRLKLITSDLRIIGSGLAPVIE